MNHEEKTNAYALMCVQGLSLSSTLTRRNKTNVVLRLDRNRLFIVAMFSQALVNAANMVGKGQKSDPTVILFGR